MSNEITFTDSITVRKDDRDFHIYSIVGQVFDFDDHIYFIDKHSASLPNIMRELQYYLTDFENVIVEYKIIIE